MVIFRRNLFGILSRSSCGKRGTKKLLVDPKEKHCLPLIEKLILNHNKRKLRFGFPSKDMVLGLPICQHVHLSAIINDQIMTKSYTPVSTGGDSFGYVDIVLKVYFKNIHPDFPEGGIMSQYLDCLKIGDQITMQGPFGHITYLDHGEFAIKRPTLIIKARKVNMIAGGKSVVPFVQFLRYILQSPEDAPECALLWSNVKQEDIILQDELEKVAAMYPNKFSLWFTLDEAGENWKYSKGYVNCEMMQCHLHPPADDTLVFINGPLPMIKAVIPTLTKIGHHKSMCITFA